MKERFFVKLFAAIGFAAVAISLGCSTVPSVETSTESAQTATPSPTAVPEPSWPPPSPKAVRNTSKFGILSPTKDGNTSCLRTRNSTLEPGDEFLYLDRTDWYAPEWIRMTVVVRTMPCVTDDSDSGGEDPVGSTSYYSVRPLDDAEAFRSIVGFALLDPNAKVSVDGKYGKAEIWGANSTNYFRACTSNEGLHFTVWSGEPLQGKLLWHRYYYVHYDTEPTCSKKDYAPTAEEK